MQNVVQYKEIHKINKYDSQEYTIEATKKIIYQETNEENLSNIIFSLL